MWIKSGHVKRLGPAAFVCHVALLRVAALCWSFLLKDAPQFVHLSLEGHLGYFQLLAVINQSSINVVIQFFVCICNVSFHLVKLSLVMVV